jgi:uncharacterized protein YhaN
VTEPHDAPDAAQLLQAVREWIERDVAPAVEGRLRFHARVAVNALAIAERELAMGPGQTQRHRERLDDLGFESEEALASAIARGELDERWEEVVAAVRDAVRDKLEVANPRYLRS